VPKTAGFVLVATTRNGSGYSQDGGTTWQYISSARYVALSFAGPTTGWASSPPAGTIVKFNGNLATAVDTPQSTTPQIFILMQNYPNPFNPETRIKFQVPATGWIELEVFNMIGQHVATLLQGKRAAGEYELIWDGRNDLGQLVPSGIYLLSLRAGKLTQTRKMVLAR
jgi:hypothetical protein